jgi:hypothetical protein
MSDADLALFKRSVPRLINTPEGNAKIVETMRAINTYVLQQAEIADAVANRDITPAEGRKALKALTNPLDGFDAAPGAAPAPAAIDTPPASFLTDPAVIEAAAGIGVTPEDYWLQLSPDTRARMMGGAKAPAAPAAGSKTAGGIEWSIVE